MSTPKKVIENNASSLGETELFDVPQSPFWMSGSEEDAIPMPSFNRRRSVLVATGDDGRVHGYRRDSRGVDGTISEEKEKILEVVNSFIALHVSTGYIDL